MVNWRTLGENLGIVEKSTQPQAPTAVAPAAPAVTAPAMQSVAPSPVLSTVPSAAPVNSDVSGLDTAQIEGELTALIEGSEKFSAYKVFNDAMTAVIQHIHDERTRYQVAGATTKLTYAEIQPSLDSWKSIVDAETANFNSSYVTMAEGNIAMLDSQITASDQEIAELTQKLGAAAEQKNKLMQEKVQREAELSKAKIDFESVIKTLTNRFTGLSQKLTQYLGGANV